MDIGNWTIKEEENLFFVYWNLEENPRATHYKVFVKEIEAIEFCNDYVLEEN